MRRVSFLRSEDRFRAYRLVTQSEARRLIPLPLMTRGPTIHGLMKRRLKASRSIELDEYRKQLVFRPVVSALFGLELAATRFR